MHETHYDVTWFAVTSLATANKYQGAETSIASHSVTTSCSESDWLKHRITFSVNSNGLLKYVANGISL